MTGHELHVNEVEPEDVLRTLNVLCSPAAIGNLRDSFFKVRKKVEKEKKM